MLHIIESIIENEEGATMVEYALLVALIAIVSLAGVAVFGISVNSLYATEAGAV